MIQVTHFETEFALQTRVLQTLHRYALQIMAQVRKFVITLELAMALVLFQVVILDIIYKTEFALRTHVLRTVQHRVHKIMGLEQKLVIHKAQALELVIIFRRVIQDTICKMEFVLQMHVRRTLHRYALQIMAQVHRFAITREQDTVFARYQVVLQATIYKMEFALRTRVLRTAQHHAHKIMGLE